jgi:uncharacterized protein
MIKATGPLCNLNCQYCYYLEKQKLYPHTRQWTMPDTVLDSFIRQYIAAQDTPSVTFIWQGGEPTLLGREFFEKVVRLQKLYAGGKRIENVLQTNGMLLDDRWGEFLARNRFLVGVSIDGPEELHDIYRRDKQGKATFGRVMRGLASLRKHKVEFNTLTAVNRKNSYAPLSVYRFLKEIGSTFIQFLPVVERLADTAEPKGLRLLKPEMAVPAAVSEWSVEPLQYGKFLCTIFDEWVRHDVASYFVQIFDVALESWVGLPQNLCVFNPRCASALALEHNGDVYSCDHYVFPENKLGNLRQTPLASLAESCQQRTFVQAKRHGLPRECVRCEVRFACNGECPKHRFVQSPEGETGLNYLCTAYKLFFKHIDPYMKFMANELKEDRAPANVMAWIRGSYRPIDRVLRIRSGGSASRRAMG